MSLCALRAEARLQEGTGETHRIAGLDCVGVTWENGGPKEDGEGSGAQRPSQPPQAHTPWHLLERAHPPTRPARSDQKARERTTERNHPSVFMQCLIPSTSCSGTG